MLLREASPDAVVLKALFCQQHDPSHVENVCQNKPTKLVASLLQSVAFSESKNKITFMKEVYMLYVKVMPDTGKLTIYH